MKAYDQGSANLLEAYMALIDAFSDTPERRKTAIEQIYRLGFHDGRMAQRNHGSIPPVDSLLEEGGGGRTFLNQLTATPKKEDETCNA
jgi:hypothetical protein